MPISVTCGCGKALRVKDEWAGRTVTCPGCGGTFVVGATGGKVAGANRGAEVWAGGRKSRGETGKGSLGEKFSISPMYIALIAFMILVPTVVFLAKIGPLKAQKQWRELEGQADSDVQSVIALALQAHLQKEGLYNPRDSRHPPGVQAVTFEPSILMVKLPTSIPFTGRCSKGFFKGTYNPHTRELSADVPGEDRSLDVTGRVNEKGVQAEIDGKPAKLDFSKAPDSEDEDAVLPKSIPRLKGRK